MCLWRLKEAEKKSEDKKTKAIEDKINQNIRSLF